METSAIMVSTSDFTKLNKSFSALGDSLQREVDRKILTAIGTNIKREYRKLTPRSKLTKSTRLWSEKIKNRRNVWFDTLKKSIVSKPSSKWKGKAGLREKGILGITAGYDYTKGKVRAAPYAHLVNDGHVAVYWGRKGGGRVAGIHWQQKAQRAAATTAAAIIKAKAKQAITAAVLKAAKKGNK